MRIIVTHASPDLDAITSIWLIRKFLQGWEKAAVKFVPAGERIRSSVFGSQLSDKGLSVSQLTGKQKTGKLESENRQLKTDNRNPIEIINGNEVIHVDTGLGPLDHHQTASDKVCAASLTWDFVRSQRTENRRRMSEDGKPHFAEASRGKQKTEKERDREEAVSRMVKVVVDTDHFKEVFWEDATADYHEFSLVSVLDGLKLAKPNKDEYYVDFISECLDGVLHEFENRIWAEKEIRSSGIEFSTRFGKGMGFETINDSVLKLAQKTGYVVVVRKDPRKGYVRVKARPSQGEVSKETKVSKVPKRSKTVDLTLAYEKLKKMDPDATWFLHIGKKMLLNGSVKNPKMRPTRLGLRDIVKVLERI